MKNYYELRCGSIPVNKYPFTMEGYENALQDLNDAYEETGFPHFINEVHKIPLGNIKG
jgi:hypothetical protein